MATAFQINGGTAMAALRFSLFRRLRCEADGREIAGLEARKVQELLIHLLLHRAHPFTREALATLLWGERNDTQARKYLRQALWQLQRALDAACHPTTPLLRTDIDWIEFDPTFVIWLDVDQLERAYEATRRIDGSELTDAQVQLLCQAVELYQGDLLEGWYQDWCITARERYQQIYLAMLDRLIAWAEHHNDHVFGIHYCELSLRCDPARERTHRRLMRLHCMAGNRTAALRQYESCAEMLHRELGVEPSRSTQLLYAQIRRDRFDAADDTPATPSAPDVELNELTNVLAHLGQLQSTLQQTLQQVQQDMDRVEAVLRRQRLTTCVTVHKNGAPSLVQPVLAHHREHK
jgi:DNA-binding SARP family transcriptional activator